MTREQFEELEAKAAREFEAAEQEFSQAKMRYEAASNAFREQMRAIEVLCRLAGIDDIGIPQSLLPATDRSSTIREVIEENLWRLPEEFTTADVISLLGSEYDRASISSTLRKMADSRSPAIEIIEVGKGSRPTLFRMTTGEHVVPEESQVESAARNTVEDISDIF